jgi:hypothetical protein
MQAWITNILPQMSNLMRLESVVCYIGQDGGPPIIKTSSLASQNGSETQTVVPQNTAYLIRKRTDAAGRRGRGRIYLPGVREDQVDAVGVVTTAKVGSFNTSFAAWRTALVTAVGARHYPPVILHRSEGAGIEPAPTPVVTLVCDARVATQRRRLRR